MISAESLYANNPTSPKVVFLYSFCLLRLDKYRAALGHLKSLIRSAPRNDKYNYNIGIDLSKLGQYNQAEWFLKQAGWLAPNDILTAFYLIENSLKNEDMTRVDYYLEKLFQVHSMVKISTIARGLPENYLRICFTPDLLVPLLTKKIKSELNKIEQLGRIPNNDVLFTDERSDLSK